MALNRALSMFRYLLIVVAITVIPATHAAKTETTDQSAVGTATNDPTPDAPQTPPPATPTPKDDSYLLVCGSGSTRTSYEISTTQPGAYCEPVKNEKGKTFGAVCWGGSGHMLDLTSATCKSGCGGTARDIASCIDSSGRTTK